MPPGLEDGFRDGRDVGRVPGDPQAIRGRGGTPARDHPAGRGSGRWPAPGASRWSRPGAAQVAGAQEDAAAWSVPVLTRMNSWSSGRDVGWLRAYDGMRYAQRGVYIPAEWRRRELLRLQAAERFARGHGIGQI